MTEGGGRVLGLDFGSRTVGVAVSDPTRSIAQGLEIIRRETDSHLRPTFRRLEELCSLYDVRLIVLGLPLNMDDTAGERAERTMAFGEKLAGRLKLPVVYQDERLSSVEAEEIMGRAGVRREHFKKYVDRVAAAVILEDYLSGHGTH